MNYYAPKERTDDDGEPSGIFDYTCQNDGSVWPVGYCAERHNKCQHRSAAEASDCYRLYIKEQHGGRFPGGFPDTSVPGEELYMTSSY
jgi:hypothetical protein